jgi:hypothetical protein
MGVRSVVSAAPSAALSARPGPPCTGSVLMWTQSTLQDVPAFCESQVSGSSPPSARFFSSGARIVDDVQTARRV